MASLSPGTIFYRRLTQMLSEFELERSPTETQDEFARRAQDIHLRAGPESDPVSGVPRDVVDAFYRVRFGHLQLEPETLETINNGLDALELRLKSP